MFIPGIGAFSTVAAGKGILGGDRGIYNHVWLAYVLALGMSLVLGGISQLLAPEVETPDGLKNVTALCLTERQN